MHSSTNREDSRRFRMRPTTLIPIRHSIKRRPGWQLTVEACKKAGRREWVARRASPQHFLGREAHHDAAKAVQLASEQGLPSGQRGPHVLELAVRVWVDRPSKPYIYYLLAQSLHMQLLQI